MTYSGSAWGDADGDGDYDLLISGREAIHNELAEIFEQLSPGNYTNHLKLLSSPSIKPDYSPSVEWADLDGDQDLDLILAGEFSSSVYRNSGSFFFSRILDLPSQDRSKAVSGDFDGDGDRDIVLAGGYYQFALPGEAGNQRATAMLFNRGNLEFEVVGLHNLPHVLSPTVSASDYDLDGDLDLLLAGNPTLTSFVCRLFINDGQGGFIEDPQEFPGFEDGASAWGDMDNDGDPDLFLAGEREGEAFAHLYFNENGTFVESGFLLPELHNPTFALGDYNNDGFLDFVFGGRELNLTPTTRLYQNNGNGTFTPVQFTLPGINEGDLTWIDEDQDGRLDLLLTGANRLIYDETILMRNQTAATNIPPGVPTGLSVAREGGSITLQWEPAIDENQTDGLTYNVRVGSTPSGHEIVPPMSDESTGFRRIVAPGNAGSLLKLSLTNLAGGTYYWSVQAVDHAFAGGAFAAEQVFQMPYAPQISSLEDLELDVNSVSNPIQFSINDVETAAGNLQLSVSSSNPDLVDAFGLEVSGTDSLRELVVTPKPDSAGESTITLTVTDGDGRTASISFLLTVIDRPPTITGLPSFLRVRFGDTPTPITFNVDDAETPLEDLAIEITSYPAILVPDGNWTLSGLGAQRQLTLIPASDQSGTSEITVTVIDSRGQSASASLLFEVYFEPPAIFGLPETIRLYPGTASDIFSFTVNDDLTPAEDILLSAVSSDPAVIPASGIEISDGGINREFNFNTHGIQVTSVLLTFTATDSNGAVATAEIEVILERFTPMALAPEGVVNNRQASWADYDGDGDYDLFLYDSDSERFYRNTTVPGSEISFELVTSGVPVEGWFGGYADWGDYDGDGDPDLLMNGWWNLDMGTTTRLYRNDGGHLTILNVGLPGVAAGNPRYTAGRAWWGDYEHDGDLDVALSGFNDDTQHYSAVYLNDGQGNLLNTSSNGIPQNAGYGGLIDWADFDNDGDLDLVGAFGDEFRIFRQEEDVVSPAAVAVLSTSNLFVRSQLPVDFEGDGRIDVFLSGRTTASQAGWSARWINQGEQGFQSNAQSVHYRVLDENYLLNSDWGDADNDGDLDGLMSGTANESGSSYTRPFTGLLMGGEEVPLRIQDDLRGIKWADVDRDGDQDFFCFYNSQPYIFKNILKNNPNPLPSVPEGLSVGQTNKVVRLSWDSSTDPNQASGLTYNVIARKTDGTPVITAHADPVTGLLNIPRRGNAGSMLHWDLKDLPAGDYEWAVQAVDVSHDGSAFSSWNPFTVQPGPVVSSIQDQTIRVNDALGPLPFTLFDANDEASELTLVAWSSNTELIRDEDIQLTGGEGSWSLSLVPTADRIGTATITLHASDGKASGIIAFQVAIVSESLMLTVQSETVIHMNATSGPLPVTLDDADYPAVKLTLEATSSDTNLISHTGLALDGADGNRTLTITPVIDQIGSATITLIARNPAGLSTTNAIEIMVVDEPPIISNMELETDEDVPLEFSLDAVDPENQPMTVTIHTLPVNGQLTGEGLERTYLSATNFFGTDSFTFSVHDGRHESAVATAQIVIHSVADTTSGVLSAEPVGNGQHLLHLHAEPLHWYRIEVSTDLEIWNPWLVLQANGSGEITQLDAVPRQQRFYRIIPQ